jgi:uncharacterized membrane protein (TIGR02234 family)
MRNPKAVSLVAIAVLAAAAMMTWSFTWFVVSLSPGSALESSLAVSGAAAAPSVVPLSLAALAIIAALAISRATVRIVLGLVLSLLGAGIALAGGSAAAEAEAAVLSSVTESMGLEGERAVTQAIDSITMSPWPTATAVIGVLLFILGMGIAVTTRRWREVSSRYDTASASHDRDAPASSVSDWDSLSTGDDPTRPER